MIKERIGNVIYYYSDHGYDLLQNERIITDKRRVEMAYAVIDLVERRIIKTRWDLQSVFDKALQDI